MTSGGERFFARVWLYSPTSHFGTPSVFVWDGRGLIAIEAICTSKRSSAPTLRVAQIRGRLPAGARATRYLVGTLQSGVRDTQITGVQMAIGRSVQWIMRDDFGADDGDLIPALGPSSISSPAGRRRSTSAISCAGVMTPISRRPASSRWRTAPFCRTPRRVAT